jgi:hypothetical protein
MFLALKLVPRAPGERSVGNQSTDVPSAGSSSPIGFCQGGFLYDQFNNAATEPPIGIGSQKFETAMAAFDDQAADDFVLAHGFGAIAITGVRVMGDYSAGGGPASSFNVYFYQNGAGNLPGAQIAAFMNLPYTGTPPDFVICLPNPFGIAPGTYWVSVQARQDSNPNGQWFWRNRTIQANADAVWQNRGDGYGTGCTTWNRKSTCMTDQVSPDQVFGIVGFREGPIADTAPHAKTAPNTGTSPESVILFNHCRPFFENEPQLNRPHADGYRIATGSLQLLLLCRFFFDVLNDVADRL